MADMRIVRDDGQELYCTGGFCTNGWTIAWEGLGDFLDLPLDIQTSANVLTDGSTLVSKRVSECERTASILYVGKRGRREVRDECLAFFNPKHSFEVHVTHLGVTRWCEGELSEVSCPIQPDGRPCECTFTLLCMDPYMRGEDIHDESMQDASPMFTFPFQCFYEPAEDGTPMGCVSSFRVYDGLNTVYNGGMVASPPRITAEFTQPVKNPTFHLNDKHVSVVYNFSAGDVLVIDFMAAPPNVTLNGENSINRCTRDSSFVGVVLELGANTFWYEAETGDINTIGVSIVYYERYTGV